MFSWLKYKNHPVFWKTYLKTFKLKQPKSIETTRFVVFDTETTGLNTDSDKILSIGAVSILNNTIEVADSIELYLKQDDYHAETIEIHGILREGHLMKFSEKDAIQQFITFLGNAVLVAHHAAFDIEMINAALKRMKLPKLKNKSIDTGILYKKLVGKKDNHFNLDVLCTEFNISKNDRHTSSGDAFITALLFLKIISKLKKERTIHYTDLFRTSNNNGLI